MFKSLGGKILEFMDVLVNKDEIFFIIEEKGLVFFFFWRYNINLNLMIFDFYWVGKELFCVVFVDKLIYVIGGYEIGNRCIFFGFLVYDIEGRFWKEIVFLKEVRIYVFGFSKNEEKIFIVRGICCDNWFMINSCECYNIVINEWEFIVSLIIF